jgi:hypothetical protein
MSSLALLTVAIPFQGSQQVRPFKISYGLILTPTGPFAPVKLGPDFAYGTADAYAGYLPDADAVVTGFSMLHESGIGGAPKYGVVSQMPTLGDVPNPLVEISSKRARGDEGSVGHFKSTLQNGIVVELAATAHAGYYQYDFPENEIGSVVVDVSHVLPSFRGFGWGQKYHGGSFRTDNDGHYEGSGVYSNGWNLCESGNDADLALSVGVQF